MEGLVLSAAEIRTIARESLKIAVRSVSNCARDAAAPGRKRNTGRVDCEVRSTHFQSSVIRVPGVAGVVVTPMLLNTLRSHKIDPKLLITHRFTLGQILEAYETFGDAAKTRALKVIIEA